MKFHDDFILVEVVVVFNKKVSDFLLGVLREILICLLVLLHNVSLKELILFFTPHTVLKNSLCQNIISKRFITFKQTKCNDSEEAF